MMMWMMWSVAVATLLGVSAHLGEWTLRDRGMAGRWPWAAAVGGSLALPAGRRLLVEWMPVPEIPTEASRWLLDSDWLGSVGSVATARTSFPAELLDSMLLWGWIVSACAALGVLASGILFLRSRSTRWTRSVVGDHEVLVSEDFGPALVGIRAGHIVLPAWALRLPDEELQLVCLHEAEHRDAGDLRLLFAGAVALCLMPWNPALWWQVRRLRTAVEMDCDARVLDRGVPRRSYGRLLLEICSGERARSVPALALAQPESLLERRMKMIVRNVSERHPVRGLVALAGSVVLLMVACDAPPPTNVDAEPPPRKADARVHVAGEVLKVLPEGIDPSGIERPDLVKEKVGDRSTPRISTLRGVDQPLLYLDGDRFHGTLSELSKEDIERIEILKGEGATEQYGEAGRNGVILIFSKSGERERTG